ncbi:nucleoside phosphorylase domain-containing protein [Trichoderma sp. SZMC 28014]
MLLKELMAVRILFNRDNKCPVISLSDCNYYVVGCMGRHNIVAVCLPFGEYGINSAAAVVLNMKRSYTGGGVPSNCLTGDYLGKTGSLQRPPDFLMTAISILESNPSDSLDIVLNSIAKIAERKPEYKYPGVEHDKLFEAENEHDPMQDTCSERRGSRITRSSDNRTHPNIHYGLIASGNKVMRDAEIRDTIGQKYNVLCFEMEAAGVMNHTPCLVIRGICDYADSHKNDLWQDVPGNKKMEQYNGLIK